MGWPELRVDEWDDFLRIATDMAYGPIATIPYLLRGQADASWDLRPSLARHMTAECSEEQACAIEKDCQRRFAAQAHLHISPVLLPPGRDDAMAWWALMQHYHAPTRLLDWTSSIFVAAYFAVVDEWEADGAIWLFHGSTLDNEVRRRSAEPVAGVHFFWPEVPSERLVAQQGAHLYHDLLLTDFETVLDELLIEHHEASGLETLRKIIVPKELKAEALRHLRAMNITAASLFPGVDGLGYSALELARLSTVYPRTG